MTAGARLRGIGRLVVAVLGVLLLVPLALGIGVWVLTAVAGFDDRPAVILIAALLAVVAVLVGGGWALTRLARRPARRRVRLIAAAVATVLVVALVVTTALAPAPEPEATPPAGTEYVQLSDGHRLAALSIPPPGEARGEPVVFLHGGPGVADLPHDAEYFGQLAATGREVWLYDQLGAGFSDRLADPSGYSLARDLSDLEEVRRHIGAEELALIGFSYGATLAANYAARHPERVSGLALLSPGRLVPQVGDVAGTGMVGRLPTGRQLEMLGLIMRPRVMTAYNLNTANPRAAHAFAGDREMDERFAQLYRITAPGLVCEGNEPPPVPPAPGFYANQVPLKDDRQYPDIRSTLAEQDIPTLLIKGGCDYLPWSFLADYRHSLPDHELVYFDDAGHVVYFERPRRTLAVLTAFLEGGALPEPTHPGQEPPASYRGAR